MARESRRHDGRRAQMYASDGFRDDSHRQHPEEHWRAGPSWQGYGDEYGRHHTQGPYDWRGYNAPQGYADYYLAQQGPSQHYTQHIATLQGYHGATWNGSSLSASYHHHNQYQPVYPETDPWTYPMHNSGMEPSEPPPRASTSTQHRKYNPTPRWDVEAMHRPDRHQSYHTNASPHQHYLRSRAVGKRADPANSRAQPYAERSVLPKSSDARRRLEGAKPGAPIQFTKPRLHYLRQSAAAPQHYPADKNPPRPLKLLVLDLNGTLVFRPGGRSTNAAERSSSAVHRPYLKCFLQYCLAVDCPPADDKRRTTLWKEWDEKKAHAHEAAGHGKEDRVRSLHGTHFWSEAAREPIAQPGAGFRLLLWSSARPENVNLMARSILSPHQAQHLLRVYARDTLVAKRLYASKAPSIKDLEILWAALNSGGKRDTGSSATRGPEHADAHVPRPADQEEDVGIVDSRQSRGEKRLFAEAREKEQQAWTGKSRLFEEEVRNLWHGPLVLPHLKADSADGYEDGYGYGPHNTLLLDDSTHKAVLQPYNHVLVPEFDEARAKVALAVRKESAASKKQIEEDRGVEEASEPEQPEEVLLQVIGVLEHARYQKNVSSWIRMGGLGDLGGMASKHPYYMDEQLVGVKAKDADTIAAEAAQYFSLPARRDAEDTDDVGSSCLPQLRATVDDRTQQFWADEGRRALRRRGIAPNMFD